MTTTRQRTGTRYPQWLVAALALFVTTGLVAFAQDTIRQDDKNKLDEYRQGKAPLGTPASTALMTKFANDFVVKLNDPEWQKGVENPPKNMSELVRELERRLQLPSPTNPSAHTWYTRLPANQRQFYEEFGKVMVKALDPATTSNKPVVRVNAARLLAE